MDYREIENKEVKVKKSRRCVWCPEMINVGERAQSIAYVLDGDFHREKLHPECYKALKLFYLNKDNQGEYYEPCEFKRGTIESR